MRSPNVGLLVLTIRDAGKGRSVEAVSGDISSMVTWAAVTDCGGSTVAAGSTALDLKS